MSQTVGLIAATLTGNHGAEAMASALIGRLRDRDPDLRFVLFSYYPKTDRKIVAGERLEIFSSTPLRLMLAHLPGALLGALLPHGLRRSLPLLPAETRRMSQCSVLVDLAGVAFIDGREKFLPFNILTIWPAMLLGVPVIKAAQALGPFNGFLNRAAARFVLPSCRAIHARGEATRHHLGALGLSNVADSADVAFLLDEKDRLVKPDGALVEAILAKMAIARASGRSIVGVCPSSVVYAKAGSSYLDSLADLVERIQLAGHAVAFIPNATRADEPHRLRNNDIPVIRRLVDALEQRGRKGEAILVDRDIDAVSIKQLIAACDVMIVSRFHAMVGALSLAKPTIVFGWSHKYAEVMKVFGMQDWVFDYTRLDVDVLFPKARALIEHRAEASDKIASALPDVRARAMGQIDTVEVALRSARENPPVASSER